MVNVGSFDAKTHLPALLKRVSKGEPIQITRRGVPIAKLGEAFLWQLWTINSGKPRKTWAFPSLYK